MEKIKHYTIEELCNENKKIIIKSQEGIEIGIEPQKEGTRLYLYFGGHIIQREFDYLISPLPQPLPIASEAVEWISVKDRLPKIGTIVLMSLQHQKQDVYSAFRAKGGWYVFRIGEESKQFIPNGIENVYITHWMPLPNPPTV